MKKYEFIPNLFWVGLSLFVMFFAYKLGLREIIDNAYNPGPGLMPFLSALLLLLLALYLLAGSLLKKNNKAGTRGIKKEEKERPNYFKMVLVLGCLFAYAFLLEPLGYPVTTFLVMLLLFKGMRVKWAPALFASLTTSLITYFVFSYLGINFPSGIISLQGVIR